LKIEIYDQTYNVHGGQDEAYLKQLAAFVDERMRAIAEATRNVDSLKVAVLAALNIADEVFTLRAEQAAIAEPLRERVEKAAALVEKALERTS
jgi:cell division protein ZapA